MLLSTALRKSWIYREILLFSVRTLHRVKFLIGTLTGVLIMKFVPDVEAEIINVPGLQTNLSEK